MLKVEVLSLEASSEGAGPVQKVAGTIHYNEKTKKLTAKPSAPRYELLMSNVLKDPVRLGRQTQINPDEEPERWIKNLYRQFGTYIRFTKAVST